MLATMHPEDVKAGLRKRYGSVADFERVKGLPAKSVTDTLRGRTSKKVVEAVEAALQENEPSPDQSELSDDTKVGEATHSLNEGRR